MIQVIGDEIHYQDELVALLVLNPVHHARKAEFIAAIDGLTVSGGDVQTSVRRIRKELTGASKGGYVRLNEAIAILNTHIGDEEDEQRTDT